MTRRIALAAVIGVAIFLACAVTLLLRPGAAAEAQTEQSEQFTGFLNARWGDPRPGSDEETQLDFVLSSRGEERELVFEGEEAKASGGPLALDGERVEVEGTPVSGDRLQVEEIRPFAPDGAAPKIVPDISGSRPNATILCRFSDSTKITPKEPSYVEGLISGTAEPGLDHYWRELSYGKVNLEGSEVYGWYNLPQPRSFYIPNYANLSSLAADCAAAADADVNFPEFTNVNFAFNQQLDGYAWGGSTTLSLDGQTSSYGATWMPPWAFTNQAAMAHELGHALGLPHSSGPYGQTYDSRWDVMSDLWGNCLPRDATYGCVGVHTIAHHKDRVGWIPPERRYVPTPGTNPEINIEKLAQPGSDGYLFAEIPINHSEKVFYTVEARRLVGYDRRLPGEAVVIHRVDTTWATGLTPVAQVVDSDNNGNPDDAGAMWVPGETFTDAQNGISVKVTGATATGGFTVRILKPQEAEDEAYHMNEDATLTATAAAGILANDPGEVGSLTATLASGPSHGTLTLNADGSFTYQPQEDFSGTDSFTYKASNGVSESPVATVRLTVAPVNDAPSFTKGPDQTVAEDSGPQTLPGWATGISTGSSYELDQSVAFTVTSDNNDLFSGQPEVSPGGDLSFTPAANAHGSAAVMVRIKDNGGTANGGTDTGNEETFEITITPVNDAPVANDDYYATNEDQPLRVAAPGLLSNVTDVDSGTLTVAVADHPTQGEVAVQPDGSFTYFPNADLYGEDSFTYRASDGENESNVATVNLTINQVDEPPPPNTDPIIRDVRPIPGSEIYDRTPAIRATVSDSGTNLSKENIKLYVDGRRVESFSYDRSTDKLSYTTPVLDPGRHTVLIVARDGQGLNKSRFWSFKVLW